MLSNKTSVAVTVSGESFGDFVSNGNTAIAGVRVNSDGTISSRIGAAYAQIDTATDWRIPNGSGAGFYVRFVPSLGDPTPIVGALNIWQEITSDRDLLYQNLANDSEETAGLTVEISDDGGTTTLDSGFYIISMIVGLPP